MPHFIESLVFVTVRSIFVAGSSAISPVVIVCVVLTR